MQRIVFAAILAALILVCKTMLNLALLAAEHSTVWVTTGFGVITLATSIFVCWYSIMGYRFILGTEMKQRVASYK